MVELRDDARRDSVDDRLPPLISTNNNKTSVGSSKLSKDDVQRTHHNLVPPTSNKTAGNFFFPTNSTTPLDDQEGYLYFVGGAVGIVLTWVLFWTALAFGGWCRYRSVAARRKRPGTSANKPDALLECPPADLFKTFLHHQRDAKWIQELFENSCREWPERACFRVAGWGEHTWTYFGAGTGWLRSPGARKRSRLPRAGSGQGFPRLGSTGWLLRGSDTFQTGCRPVPHVGFAESMSQSLFSPMHSPCHSVAGQIFGQSCRRHRSPLSDFHSYYRPVITNQLPDPLQITVGRGNRIPPKKLHRWAAF